MDNTLLVLLGTAGGVVLLGLLFMIVGSAKSNTANNNTVPGPSSNIVDHSILPKRAANYYNLKKSRTPTPIAHPSSSTKLNKNRSNIIDSLFQEEEIDSDTELIKKYTTVSPSRNNNPNVNIRDFNSRTISRTQNVPTSLVTKEEYFVAPERQHSHRP